VLPDVPAYIGDIDANDVYLYFGYTFNKRIKLNGGLTYDVDEASSKQWRFGGSYQRDCWNATAYIRQDIVPRPIGYTTDNSFYVQLNFIPFGTVGSQ
jgi:lipopolysaccharide assembly outer membrane protein LptD (OstA)